MKKLVFAICFVLVSSTLSLFAQLPSNGYTSENTHYLKLSPSETVVSCTCKKQYHCPATLLNPKGDTIEAKIHRLKAAFGEPAPECSSNKCYRDVHTLITVSNSNKASKASKKSLFTGEVLK